MQYVDFIKKKQITFRYYFINLSCSILLNIFLFYHLYLCYLFWLILMLLNHFISVWRLHHRIFIGFLFYFFPYFLVAKNTGGPAGPSVPFVPDPQQLDFSVPPPNFYPGHQAPPATLVTQASQKSDADIEWEKKMAEFVQKTKPDRPKRDDLDAKINEHLSKSTPPSSSSKSGKKRRTFTDYPVTDEPIASKVSTSNSGAKGKNFVICSLLHENSISSFNNLNKIASLVQSRFQITYFRCYVIFRLGA